MAEVTAMRNNALPYPIYGAPYTIVYPMLDADGDLVTGATTPDAEISKNGDTFADCTNESTEIATSSGVYYLTLTGTELTCDMASIIAKSATAGMKTTVATLYPRKLVSIRAGTAADDGSGTSTIVLDAGASAIDDFYNGMVCVAVIDTLTEVRMITDYNGTTKAASVTPDWNVAPDVDDTFTIYLPEGVQMQQANVTHINSTAQTARDIGASVLLSSGTGTGQLDFTSGVVKANAVQLLGTAWLTPGTAGTPDVNAKLIGGTAQTGRDIGASVLLSSGTGTGQLDFTSGVVKANVTQYGGSAGTFASGRPEVNATSINGDATSAANLAKTTRAIARGTVTTGASTTSIPTSAFTPAGVVADQFKGRIVTFDADTTTTALRGQSTDITANTSAATPTLTVTALTSTPASGDTFSVT